MEVILCKKFGPREKTPIADRIVILHVKKWEITVLKEPDADGNVIVITDADSKRIIADISQIYDLDDMREIIGISEPKEENQRGHKGIDMKVKLGKIFSLPYSHIVKKILDGELRI